MSVVVVVDLDDGRLQLLDLDLPLQLDLPAGRLLGHAVKVKDHLVLLLTEKENQGFRLYGSNWLG